MYLEKLDNLVMYSMSNQNNARIENFVLQNPALGSNSVNDDNGCFLSQMLPYDPCVKIGDRLDDGLKEYSLLLNAAEQALLALKEGKLGDFDPIVGENACQIRAIKLALTISNCEFEIEKILEKLESSKVKIKKIMVSVSKIDKRKLSLDFFLRAEKLDFSVNYNLYWLIKYYILTRTKILRFSNLDKPLVKNDVTDSKKIKEISSVGSLFAKNFVTSLREKISVLSVQFVQKMAKTLDPDDFNTEMVSDNFSVLHRGLLCIPCFWTTRILMQLALNNRTPIVIQAQQKAKDEDFAIVKAVSMYFEATSSGYRLTSKSEIDSNIPSLILLGSTCRNRDELPDIGTWMRELATRGPVDLILAYAAAHRQYPDEIHENLVLKNINDEKYNYYKRKAIEWGCSLENPSQFFLAHAYCDKIKNLENFS